LRQIFYFLIFSYTALHAQSEDNKAGTLNGFVHDKANGEALISANVYLSGTRLGAVTNLNGYYVIPRIPSGDYNLMCQYLGYNTFSKRIHIEEDEKKQIDIFMQGEGLAGEEFLVVEDSIPTAQKLFEKPISRIQLSGVQIAKIPQVVESDLLRSLQTIPGIVPLSDFSSQLYVRGGTPDQNLYLLDGTDVYNPEHAFGIFSTFNTDAIKQVDISKGGFGAEYGGRLSSVLDVTNLDGNRNKFEGVGSISLLSARTTLQMPIGDIGSISGSFRRTYFDKTIGPSLKNFPVYYFYDGNVKAFFMLNKKNTLTLSGYGGQDVLNFTFNQNSPNAAGLHYNWGNRTGSIHWAGILSPQLFANFWITGSRFASAFDFSQNTGVNETNSITDLTVKGNLEYHNSKQWITKFGFEQKNLHVIYKQNFQSTNIAINGTRQVYSAYAQNNWRPTDNWDIETGLRFDLFHSEKNYKDIDPRFSVKYRLTETLSLKGAAGIYHQYLDRIPRSFIVGIWTTADQFQKGSQAYHYIVGAEKTLADNYQVEVESYYKIYTDLYSLDHHLVTQIQPTSYTSDGTPVYGTTQGLFDQGKGTSVGMELLVRKDVGTVTGWLGYSLAHTVYNVHGINQNKPFVPRHDRTHVVNMVMNMDIRDAIRAAKGLPPRKTTSHWLLGMNFVYTSGQPTTTPSSSYYTGPTPDANQNIEVFPSDINKSRLPAYARLDLTITYLKQYRTWSLSPFLQVYNIGNRKNVWFVDYTRDNANGTATQSYKPISQFPLLPSIGVSFKF
jgi:outer membrane receptor protein involved in Fe transport